ncbi:MAG: DUF721 domain-containing protein [Nitrospirota bacterium]
MLRTDSILSPIIKNLGIDDGVCLARIKNNWYRIFNKPLSLHMYPSKFAEGELLINVDSPIWIQQLGYYKKEIIDKLSDYGVRDIRFRLGKIYGKRENVPAREHAVKELSREDNLFVSELLSNINDESLKASIRKALEKSLRSSKSSK